MTRRSPPSADAGNSVPSAVLVSVGDELLLGRTVDSNAAWLADELGAFGLGVLRGYTVADRNDEIQRAVTRGLDESEVVLVTGGLGPTNDDRTKGAVAVLLNLPLLLDRGLLERLEARFRTHGYERLPEKNMSQAQVPQGARILANPLGTAPGLAMEQGSSLVVLLPGVPREMKAIVQGDLKTMLLGRFQDRLLPVRQRTFHTTGVPESDLAGRVETLLPEEMGPLSLAFLPDLTGVDLRFTARGVSAGEAESWFEKVQRSLAPLLEEYGFQAHGGDIVEPLGHALMATGRRVAVAESCTGGLLARRLTERPGSSDYFVGAVVAYHNAVKADVLGVSTSDLEKQGAVSEEVARQMARGVARLLDCEAAVAVTGVAGPGGGSVSKPVGTVWCSALVDDQVVARRQQFSGDRSAVRERAAQAALTLLLRSLEGGRP